MIREKEVAPAIAKWLKRKRSKSATMAQCIEALPRLIKLSKKDMQQSASRPSELRYVSAIRNLRSHGTCQRHGLQALPNGGFALL